MTIQCKSGIPIRGIKLDFEDSWIGFAPSFAEIIKSNKKVVVHNKDGQVTTYTYKED